MNGASVLFSVSEQLSKLHSKKIIINKTQSVGGGSINDAQIIYTNAGNYFLKSNLHCRFPGMFTCEVKGLNLLRESGCIQLPEVIATDGSTYLLLEFITPAKRNANYWSDAGINLAQLHKNSNSHFGLDHDNFIGTLPQQNIPCISGVEFMIHRRFQPMIEMAVDNGLLDASAVKQADIFYSRLNDLLPNENPALLHGDLWNGNIITGADGNICFIDPAIYYGYRETDLAMTRLFGGFDEEFYSGYQSEYPLLEGWEERIAIFQLFPLLVHLNLFGRSYLNNVLEVLNRYS